ncbi:hypothetical protein EI94DRAFT_1740599 [Lactarius quietus]|nr:hypothetical protein EI94DRAFT_1740599 [Lactarius quietus]
MGDRSPQSNDESSAQYWSDAVQTRLELVDNLLQRVPHSTLDDATVLRVVDHEMFSIVAGPLGVIANRRNTLTRTCRIPQEILGQIFLHYQRLYGPSWVTANKMARPSPLHKTTLWWVPAVAHVCRHWRTVAFQVPQLWSNIALHLGRTWALRMLTLSRAVPITIAMNDPLPCEASIRPLFWGRLPKPGPPKLDPLEVLARHLSHIRELELGACSCTSLRWVSLLEASAPCLETLWLRINPHRPGTLPNAFIALPDNFLATHPRLRRLVLENAYLSSWSPGLHTLSQLTVLTITPPPAVFAVPTHKRSSTVSCLCPTRGTQPRALPSLHHFSTLSRTVHLLRLRKLTLQDRVDRCHQVFHSLSIPATAIVKVVLWYALALSNLDFLRILPSLFAHLYRTGADLPTSSRSQGSSRALSLSTTYNSGRTHFLLSAWRTFTPPTSVEARWACAVKCEWGVGNPDMERRALLEACAGVSGASLRASAYRLLLALELYTGSGSAYRAPLFPELASLTLVGVDFVRMGGAAWRSLSGALFRREASRTCVTILDRIELRSCTVKKKQLIV